MRPAFAIACVVAAATSSTPAIAALDPSTADAHVHHAVAEHRPAFCRDTSKPTANDLPSRDRALCPLAESLTDCPGFAAACDAKEDVRKPVVRDWSFLKWLFDALSTFAQIASYLLWGALFVAVLVAGISIYRAVLKMRRDEIAAEPEARADATFALDEITLPAGDPTTLLRLADAHVAEGRIAAAIALYLEATLVALERVGAIERAKHRTNGEYVRQCSRDDARRPLADVARAFDTVKFGHRELGRDEAIAVGDAARALVTRLLAPATLVVGMLLATLLAGCTNVFGGERPHGDELLHALLTSQGITIVEVGAPIASLEPPKPGESQPTLLIDADRTPLDEDAQIAFERWLRGGGHAIVVGDASSWPKSLGLQIESTSARAISVPRTPRSAASADDDDDAEESATSKESAAQYKGELAQGSSIKIRNGRSVATIGGDDYAEIARVRDGEILALGNGDLFTNAALLRPGNPAVLVAILSAMPFAEIRLVRPEDGSSAAGDPLSALVHAGLGPALAQSAFALVILFAAYGVAFGRRVPPRLEVRRAFSEHVRAVGALWSTTRLGRHALAAYVRWAEARAREAVTYAGEEPALLLSRRTGRSLDECRAIWSNARARADADGTQAPQAIAALAELARLVQDAHLTERFARQRAGQPGRAL